MSITKPIITQPLKIWFLRKKRYYDAISAIYLMFINCPYYIILTIHS